jgi:hypothetical protein
MRRTANAATETIHATTKSIINSNGNSFQPTGVATAKKSGQPLTGTISASVSQLCTDSSQSWRLIGNELRIASEATTSVSATIIDSEISDFTVIVCSRR